MPTLRGLIARPRIVLPAAIVVVAAGSLGGWAATRSSAAASPSFRLVAAATTTMRQTASSTGTIEPTTTATLSFGASGQVTSVKVKVGQKVKKGQALAAIDSASLKAQVAQAKAGLAAARSRLSQDQANSASSAQVSADQAAVTSAKSQVDSAKASLSGATLTSPIKGTVASVGLTVGQQVSGGSSGGTGGGGGSGNSGSGSSGSSSDSITVVSNAYVVDASVDATVIGNIKTGDQAVITTGGASGPVYGTVGSVGLTATSSSGVASFPVVIDVTGKPSGLYAGASATVAIIYRQLTGVLSVPVAAVHTSNGKSVVYTMVNGHRVERTVTTGLTSGGQIQIKSGLSAGDQVVVDIPRRTGTSTGGTSNTRGRFRPGGGLGGGGFPVGGRTGGRGGLGGAGGTGG